MAHLALHLERARVYFVTERDGLLGRGSGRTATAAGEQPHSMSAMLKCHRLTFLCASVGHVLRCAHGKRQDGHGRVLIAARNEAAAIHHEQVLDVVALVPLVQHALLGIVAHAAGAQLVDAVARRERLVVLRERLQARADGTAPRRCSWRAWPSWFRCRRTCTGCAVPECRSIHHVLIDADEILIARQHFAHDGDRRSLRRVRGQLLFQFRAISRNVFRIGRAADAEVEGVAADEILLPCPFSD